MTNQKEWWKEKGKVNGLLTEKLDGYEKLVWIWLKVLVGVQIGLIAFIILSIMFGGLQ